MTDMQNQAKTKFIPLIIFAIAMGFFEAVVVVYLRELHYPEGFEFPLKTLPSWLMIIEIVREISTLLMLFSVAWISGKNFLQQLSAFLLLFGIWDIVYYVGLKIFLDWPESLFTWDLLFLIPIAWLGPVLAPVICSLLMIVIAVTFENFRLRKGLSSPGWPVLGLMITGSVIIYITFTFDIGRLIIRGKYIGSLFKLSGNSRFIEELTTYSPSNFLWEIFLSGLVFIIAGLVLFINRNRTT